jgi:hypothetical protein
MKSLSHKQKSNTVVDIQGGTSQKSPNEETTNLTVYKCQFCDRIFTRSSSLSKHEKICASKIIKSKVTETENILKMKELEMELKLTKSQLTSAHNQIDELKKYIKSTPKQASNITYNVSVKNYVQQNYPNAPALEGIQDYAKLTYDIEDFAQILVNKYNDNLLHKYLGDFIIQYYKKDDPSEQSLWNSDISRLTYIIKELVANNKSLWNHDPKGVKTKNFIINPLMKYIKEYIDEYWIENIDMHNLRSMNTEKIISMQSNLQTLQKIKKDINNDTIAINIIKYIAPHFYMNRSDIGINDHFIDNNIDSDE